MRVSANAWLDTDIKEVEKMSRRIDLLTGLRTTKSLDPHKEAKEDQYELFQVNKVVRFSNNILVLSF